MGFVGNLPGVTGRTAGGGAWEWSGAAVRICGSRMQHGRFLTGVALKCGEISIRRVEILWEFAEASGRCRW